MDKLQYAIGNSASTTSSSSISNSSTSLPLTSDTNFGAKDGEGMVLIDEGEATEELAYATGKSGSSLTIPLANRGLEGGSAYGHSSGASVKGILTAGMWNNLIDTLTNLVSKSTGAIDTTKVVTPTATQTLTNKTLTTPKINEDVVLTASSTELNLLDGIVGLNKMPFNAPEGFLINGRIVPSVSSNNLTVAIKGMDGNDPSASNPVYVRIGNTIRSITSALSVTRNAGTNWFNAGSSELATKEIDYFVYLGYNATDGVVIGFARIPYASVYSNFSTTTTNEKYCAISTTTNATANDTYVVVGRFAATLSAGAGYTWSVPTFTSSNLIQRPIYETRFLSFTPVCSGLGGSAGTYAQTLTTGDYIIRGKVAFIEYNLTITNKGSWSSDIFLSTPIRSLYDNETRRLNVFINASGTVPVAAAKAQGMVKGNTNAQNIGFQAGAGTSNLSWASVATGDMVMGSAEYEI